jgi:hypothetical protein
VALEKEPHYKMVLITVINSNTTKTRGRKGSSCARSEEIEMTTDRKNCSTGQSPQRAVVLMEEEEEEGGGGGGEEEEYSKNKRRTNWLNKERIPFTLDVLKPTLHGLTKNASPGLSILYR